MKKCSLLKKVIIFDISFSIFLIFIVFVVESVNLKFILFLVLNIIYIIIRRLYILNRIKKISRDKYLIDNCSDDFIKRVTFNLEKRGYIKNNDNNVFEKNNKEWSFIKYISARYTRKERIGIFNEEDYSSNEEFLNDIKGFVQMGRNEISDSKNIVDLIFSGKVFNNYLFVFMEKENIELIDDIMKMFFWEDLDLISKKNYLVDKIKFNSFIIPIVFIKNDMTLLFAKCDKLWSSSRLLCYENEKQKIIKTFIY